MAAILAPVAAPSDLVVRDWLVIERLDVAGRRPFRCDAVFAKHLLDAKAAPPKAGEKLAGELGKEAAWEARTADESGAVAGRIEWAYAAVEVPAARVALADLQGAATLYVNGAPFAGDLYRYGFQGVPVALREGRNEVYVGGIREGFSLRFREPPGPLVLASWDATLPDAPKGEGAVLVLNAADRPVDLEAPGKRRLLPLEAAKVAVDVDLGSAKAGKHAFKVEAVAAGASASATFEVEIRERGEAERRTYRSLVDGSVQPFAARAPSGDEEPEDGFGLVLTLHGAGVDALGQARAYSPKPDFWIVAPTNRRPFGFDWQDWGRRDAYDVLENMLEATGVDEDRVYLTGHSMGGHGTWHLAVNDPDTFAAIAPSAGWISFDTYPGRPKGALAELWQRADGASRTLDLLANLSEMPVYALHGAADDNVPASEARTITSALKELRQGGGKDSMTLELREGAGHWWDGDAAAGADCVDWPPIFELFRRSNRSGHRTFEWTSVDPSVDSRNEWIEVTQLVEYGRPFRVKAERGIHDDGEVTLATENVRRLRIALPWNPRNTKVSLDGFVQVSKSGRYVRGKDGWVPDESPAPATEKSELKSGPFKRAFDNRFFLVYGTAGDERERKEQLDLARFVAQCWWYRGNGSAEIQSDVEFAARHASNVARNVILLGNRDTNAAWNSVVSPACPIDARRGSLRIGEKRHEGADLAALFAYPRGDGPGLLGALADTGAPGTRLLAAVPVFVSGVGLPDYALIGPEVLTKGDGGVLAAGWFDHAWGL